MDLPAYMVGIGTFLAGAAALAALWVRRGEPEHEQDEFVAYLQAQLDECEQRERARNQPHKRRDT